MGRRNVHGLPPLSRKKILAWADAHYARTGRWPKVTSGPVRDAPGEDWRAIDAALRSGGRKIAGRTSLARLLAAKRGVPNRGARPPLTEEQIVDWARLHYARTGAWPNNRCGPIHDAPQETWAAVDTALRHGRRNLPGGSSLQELREHLQQVPADVAEPAEALA